MDLPGAIKNEEASCGRKYAQLALLAKISMYGHGVEKTADSLSWAYQGGSFPTEID